MTSQILAVLNHTKASGTGRAWWGFDEDVFFDHNRIGAAEQPLGERVEEVRIEFFAI